MKPLILILTLIALAAVVPARTELVLSRSSLPADGRATARLAVERVSLLGLRTPASARPRGPLELLEAADGSYVLRAGTRPGVARIEAGDAAVELTLTADARDLDEDGYPDAAELMGEGDRAAFVAWFTAIAEAQAKLVDDAWPAVHHDCAGLVRFAYREALRAHDAAWLARRRHLASISAPDVAAFHYPELPFLGELPFRERGGAFRQGEPAFTAAASARALLEHASRLVSRDVAEARPGDLLFFATADGLHTMIALGARAGATPIERATRVVYHTGGAPGEVRVVAISDLSRHPDPAWHPAADNARFLGVHRLAILEHEPRRFAALEGP